MLRAISTFVSKPNTGSWAVPPLVTNTSLHPSLAIMAAFASARVLCRLTTGKLLSNIPFISGSASKSARVNAVGSFVPSPRSMLFTKNCSTMLR